MQLVSIIMPAYNAAAFISEAITSVIEQTYSHWELIIIDDGSTDQTAAIVRKFQQTDSRISYYYQCNTKQAAARNNGVAKAKGEWIAYLDADDLWLKNKLEKQLTTASLSAATVIYTGGYIFDYQNNSKIPYPTEYGPLKGEEMYRKLFIANIVPILSVIIKKDLVQKIGQQDESLNMVGCEDLDYWLRLAKYGASFYGIEENLFLYRTNPSGISRNNLQMSLARASALIKNYDKKYFSNKQERTIFKSFFDHLIVDLFKAKKLAEIKILFAQLVDKSTLVYFKINNFFVQLGGYDALLPVRSVSKIDSILNGKS